LHIDNENAANMIYPIGIQNFESMRNDGYVYVDKTALVYELATTGRYYFSESSAPLR
jgi:phosphoribosyl-AMP cyclohydrolase